MILEYIDGESLFTWLNQPNKVPSLIERTATLRDVARLMRSFETFNVVCMMHPYISRMQ